MPKQAYRLELEMAAASGVQWPLSIYVCKSCSRPTMFEQDKCCFGMQDKILVMPVQVLPILGEYQEGDPMLEDLDLMSRTYNAIRRSGHDTIRDVLKRPRSFWWTVPNFGKLSMENLEQALREKGFELPDG